MIVELRSSLLPPRVPSEAIPELAALVCEIDLLRDGEADAQMAEFNRRVGSHLVHEDFREYFASRSAEEFAYEQLVVNAVSPTPDVSTQELVELVRRAMDAVTTEELVAYHALLRVNGAGRAIAWIYWPPDGNATTATWGRDRPLSEYDPSAEQIVSWLSSDQPTS